MKKCYLLLLLLAFIFTIGCSSDPTDMDIESLVTKGPTGEGGSNTGPAGGFSSAFGDYKEGPVVLGKDISAIHSVASMRAAYAKQYPNGDGQYGPSAIRTTHYYVRFLPKNEDEYDSIMQYDLSEIPLYNQLVKGGSSYHDPSIPADQYTWQYALIPVGNFKATAVQYEILQNMFIVENGATGVPGPGGTPSYTFWEKLEMLNHKAETGEDIGQGISWTPKGKIEVYDDFLKKYIPLEDVTVFISSDNKKPQIVYTDVNGDFKSRYNYTTSVYYQVVWSPKYQDFEVKNGLINKAYLVSNRSFLPFNAKLDDSQAKQKNIATVYRAAYRTYRKDYLNINRPRKLPINQDRPRYIPTRIAYLHESHNWADGFYHHNGYTYNPDTYNITLYGLNMSSQRIFKVVTHELAHAGHDIMFPKYNWSASNRIIHESWASAVEYYITKLEYQDYGIDIDTYANIRVSGSAVTYGLMTTQFVVPDSPNKQWWPHAGNQARLDDDLEYSPLIIDLIDYTNQALYYKLNPVSDVSHKTYPNDEVYGFELNKIQTALGATGLADFKNKIKTINRQYYSTKNTDIEIDTLFRRYEHYWNK